ncbi:putative leucine-rich repeat receptor-like protein kinase, partial [Mucuna pruriens]
MLPQFDLLLGANWWGTMRIYNASIDRNKEIIYVPSRDYVQICLVDTGYGTPFISSIELRILNNATYVTQFGSLELYCRYDLGSNIAYRYNYDVYDRFWYIWINNNDWKQLNASIPADSLKQNDYKPAAIAMSTAITPVNTSAPLVISWVPQDQNDQVYVYMHFTELHVLAKNQTREFNIIQNGKPWLQNFSPQYLNVTTITSVTSGKEIKYSLEKTKNSTLPPIINAIEIYRIIDFQQSDTFQGDIDAITTIKSVYGVTRDWQGDPCAPVAYLWDGLNCTYGANESPRITTLNLSSSGLSGKIDPSISKLTMLENLDLSNNSLNDEVPDFLSQLQHLKIFLGQNPYLCESGQCNEKKKKSIVTPLVASISGVLILLVAVAILWTLKRRKSKEKLTASMEVNDQNEISLQSKKQDDSLQQLKKQIYSYYDVLKITNNFNIIIGKGGFGTVYLGYIDDTPVAVKMLSPSSVHGYQQFQTEVKLLMRVHHKNLTSLIGYCNEETNKGLIYEYMANGNLQEHLSGKHSKSKFLSWEDRIRIALDAALGLEYLQNGCKPPIIHRDVKSTNILLNEQFQAKISDFGLSKIIPTDGVSHVSTVVAGTLGYLDPHYSISSRLTEKSDVYSFGVVLLEIITNQPVMARNQEKGHISEWVSSLVATGDIKGIVDSRLEGNFDINSAWKAVEIAMACVSLNPNERPIMSVVVFGLKETLATELARTKHHSGADSRYSFEPINVNLDTEFMPQASIDCGVPQDVSYTESTTGINYISDANFINSGESNSVVSELKRVYQRQMWSVRSFPGGIRNCYKINITRGSKYLIRTGFLYGNYDGINMLPQFDILLGANRWGTVTIYNASLEEDKEIIYTPSLDYVRICLVNTGLGTPFISTIELRALKSDIYTTQFGSLETYYRVDLGSNISYRYKYDVYDRFWDNYDSNSGWTRLSAFIPAHSLEQKQPDYKVPEIVMSTAVTPLNANAPLLISWVPEDQTDQFYVYMHFTEIQVLAKNQTREFIITQNGNPWNQNYFSPPYQAVYTLYSASAATGKKIIFSLQKAKNSSLPPIINAIEIYRVLDFQQSDTFQGDVDAITTIKSVYRVTRDWQGDPCVPVAYLWSGLNCAYDGNDSPRITAL